MGNDYRRDASGAQTAEEVVELLGRLAAEGRGRFVEDEEADFFFAADHGLSDLDHLALSERKAADPGPGGNTTARKDVLKTLDDRLARATAPAPAPERGPGHVDVLENAQRWAQGELLEDYADAPGVGLGQ